MVQAILAQAHAPVVIDADGLNLISGHPALNDYIGSNTVLTPHLGEMSRLTGLSAAQIKEDPKNANKPDNIIEKMLGGKINKFYETNCLVEQTFVKDDSMSVEKFLASKGVKLVDFVRFEKGEGLEKKADDFAAEVASMMK